MKKATTMYELTKTILSGIIELRVKIDLDLTVKLPFKYFRENRYIMLVYSYYINTNQTEAMKNSEGKSIANKYETLTNRLVTKVFFFFLLTGLCVLKACV